MNDDAYGKRILLAIMALWGLAGVALLAAGGHMDPSGRVTTAGQFLLFHAAATLALMALPMLDGWRRAVPVALMLTGTGLFAGEIVIHLATGMAQLAFLAPVGGSVTMLGWLALAVGVLVPVKPNP